MHGNATTTAITTTNTTKAEAQVHKTSTLTNMSTGLHNINTFLTADSLLLEMY